jgi:hypothetical protein
MKKLAHTLSCLIIGASSLTAGIVVDIVYNDPSDTVLTATISGSGTLISSPNLNEWAVPEEEFEWRLLDRNSGVNILATGGSFRNNPVTNSSAIASNGTTSITVTEIDFFSRSSDNRNDFGFSFDQEPSFSGGDVITFSGSFDFTLSGKTAADFSVGTWTADFNDGIYWTNDFIDSNLTLTVSQVPEPSTYAAIAGIFAVAWIFLRRRNRGIA